MTDLELARKVLRTEAAAILALVDRVDERFANTVALLCACRGRVIVTGMGKSGLIARKIAATLSSTGTPAFFLHPAEAVHGDLGAVQGDDIVIALSHTGETGELLRLLETIRRIGARLVAMTGSPASTLGLAADVVLDCGVDEEACPLNLAPTASTTAALALGDALAMVLLESRGLTREDFAKYHPAGTLGMTLLLRVKDIMRTGEACPVRPEAGTTVQEAIFAMTKAKAGAVALVNRAGVMTGIFTDGDFWRSALTGGPDFLLKPVGQFMTRNPRSIPADVLAVEALKLFQQFKISDLVALDAEQKPVGYIDVQDLPKLKIL